MYTPVQLTPAMVPAEGCNNLTAEGCNNLTIWHCCILPSVPLQVTSIGCEDGTAMFSGTPNAASRGKLNGIPPVRIPGEKKKKKKTSHQWPVVDHTQLNT